MVEKIDEINRITEGKEKTTFSIDDRGRILIDFYEDSRLFDNLSEAFNCVDQKIDYLTGEVEALTDNILKRPENEIKSSRSLIFKIRERVSENSDAGQYLSAEKEIFFKLVIRLESIRDYHNKNGNFRKARVIERLRDSFIICFVRGEKLIRIKRVNEEKVANIIKRVKFCCDKLETEASKKSQFLDKTTANEIKEAIFGCKFDLMSAFKATPYKDEFERVELFLKRIDNYGLEKKSPEKHLLDFEALNKSLSRCLESSTRL